LGMAFAQGTLGCLVAHTLNPAAVHRVAFEWPLFLGVTLLVMAASAVVGVVLTRRQLLPGTTAIWGIAPGAASAMVLMADAYGADVRLVALMQYLRVVLVTLLATLVAGVWSHQAVAQGAPHAVPAVDWLAWNSTAHVATTLGVVLGGIWLSRRLRLAVGAMMLPLGIGLVLQGFAGATLELPPVMLAVAYALLGWSVGLRFNRGILLHAWRLMPYVLAAIFAMVAFGLVLAAGLHWLGGFDPLTAYLATSPGGADSVAVISASAAVDSGFVMAMQLARFAMVLLTGPAVFRWVARQSGASGCGAAS
jgi:membrane AbrB-like protein